MSKGSDSMPLLMATLFGAKRLSKIELSLLAISTLRPHALGNKAFIAASGYIGSASLKTSCPFGFSL
jgi:hypothetical protein